MHGRGVVAAASELALSSTASWSSLLTLLPSELPALCASCSTCWCRLLKPEAASWTSRLSASCGCSCSAASQLWWRCRTGRRSEHHAPGQTAKAGDHCSMVPRSCSVMPIFFSKYLQ